MHVASQSWLYVPQLCTWYSASFCHACVGKVDYAGCSMLCVHAASCYVCWLQHAMCAGCFKLRARWPNHAVRAGRAMQHTLAGPCTGIHTRSQRAKHPRLLRRCCVVSRILQPRLRGVLHCCTYRRSDACRAVIGLHIAAAHSALCHDSYHGSHPVATVYLRLAAACVAAYKHSYAQHVSPVEQPLTAATAN